LRQDALVGLADLRRLQGRFEEAAALLDEIEGHPASILQRASLALDRSEPAVAVQLAQRILRRLPQSNRTDRFAALDVAVRAQIALGQRKEFRASLEKLVAIAGTLATEPMKATALAAEGLVASAEGEHDRARNAFEDAIELFARSGAAFEMARCRVELGRVLGAAGERETADAEIREALSAFESLGAVSHVATATALRRDIASGAKAAPDRTQSSTGLTRREV
jgi:tetratricopeptide (TPR) repeat protein